MRPGSLTSSVPQLPSFALVCASWDESSPRKAWGGHLGRSPSDVGERGYNLGSELGTPCSVLCLPNVALACIELRVTK